MEKSKKNPVIVCFINKTVGTRNQLSFSQILSSRKSVWYCNGIFSWPFFCLFHVSNDLYEKNKTTSVKKDCNDFWWLINNRNSNRRNDTLYKRRGRSFTTFTRRGRSDVVLALAMSNIPTQIFPYNNKGIPTWVSII